MLFIFMYDIHKDIPPPFPPYPPGEARRKSGMPGDCS